MPSTGDLSAEIQGLIIRPIIMRVLFSSIHSPWPWFRQTPKGDGVSGELSFTLDSSDAAIEWIVVFDEPEPGLTTQVPLGHRILFITEPPGVKSYPAAYLNQFGIVVSPFPLAGYKGHLVVQQSALQWYYGVDMGAEERDGTAMAWGGLAADKEKSKELSVICSNKTIVPHQRVRLAFVARLKERLGDRVDAYGRGFREVGDKAEAIGPYRYHIVLENNLIDNFWTEKLADAWLGDCYPIFAGCRNVDQYFDTRGMACIDISDPDRAIDQIERILASGAWERNRDAIRANRCRLMAEHNLFAVAARLIGETSAKPDRSFSCPPTAIRESFRMGFENKCRRVLSLVRSALRWPIRRLVWLVPKETRMRWKQQFQRYKTAFLGGGEPWR